MILCYSDENRLHMLGVYIFKNFKDILLWSDGYISYNDYVRPSRKKRCFEIIKYEDRGKT